MRKNKRSEVAKKERIRNCSETDCPRKDKKNPEPWKKKKKQPRASQSGS